MRAYDAHDAEIAEIALAAFRGAATRLAALSIAPAEIARRTRDAADALTPAERDVLAVLVEGESNAGIARRLHVSIETVKTHLYRAFRKLGVSSRARAIVELRGKPLR